MAEAAGEFERIDRHLRPLASSPGARGLADDGGLLPPNSGGWAVTTDTIVGGVHFRGDEPADSLARKLLGVNLSDCAALAARPRFYSLNLALPAELGDSWWARFSGGLAALQRRHGLDLLGGDCTAAPGPPVLTATLYGEPPAGGLMSRAGARPGDWIWVSGTVGDGALGLGLAAGTLPERARDAVTAAQAAYLLDRYRHPRPRWRLARCVRPWVTAGLDISDGLLGDLGHLASASGVGAKVNADSVPLSPAAAAVLAAAPELHRKVLTGGDDYELVLTAPPEAAPALRATAACSGVALAPIGAVVSGSGLACYAGDGRPIGGEQGGWQHPG